LGKNRSKPEWLFCNEVGTMLDPDNVRHRVFYKLLETTGLRRIRIHDLRHTFATRLLMNGESPAYVKEQMGHSSIHVTVDLYCHWIPGSNRQAVDRLDQTVDIPKTGGQSATRHVTARSKRSCFHGSIWKLWSRRSGLNGRPAVYEWKQDVFKKARCFKWSPRFFFANKGLR
jgi:hypothetical protein